MTDKRINITPEVELFADLGLPLSERNLIPVIAAALENARKEERNQVAKWYETQGWYLDESDVADAIRSLK